MTDESNSPIYRFGLYEADVRSGELRKRGLRIRLQTQPFQVLTRLLAEAGKVVTRETLKQELWSGDTFVDFDHGLNSAVNKIRQALGDTAANPRFVETVPRVGYRFVAPVEIVRPPAPAVEPRPAHAPIPTPPPPAAPDPTPPEAPSTGPWKVLLGISVGALGALLAVMLWPSPDAPVADPFSLRILAGRNTTQTDAEGRIWRADSFYQGGETATRHGAVFGAEQPFLFGGERYGSFAYVVPAPAGSYTVRLHFAETWFGAGNPGGGGPGSRRFDVAINGDIVLEDFEPIREAGGASRAIVREFEDVRPGERGAIEVSFVPERDNPMVNAVEILP